MKKPMIAPDRTRIAPGFIPDRTQFANDRTGSHQIAPKYFFSDPGWRLDFQPSAFFFEPPPRANSCQFAQFVSGPLPARADSFGYLFLPPPIAPDSSGYTQLTTRAILTYPQSSAAIRTENEFFPR